MSYTIDGWIDEMNLLKSEKTARKSTAKSLDRKLGDFFIRQLEDLIMGLFLIAIKSQDYRDELTDIYMMYAADKDDEWMKDKAKRFANQIEDATENAVREVEGKPEFTQAVLFGNPIKKSDIPKKVRDAFSQDRATRIAMNEANVIHNYKRHLELAETQDTHTWDATLDEVTRPHHWEADGQTVPINEPFVVAGEKLMFPGDDSLGATAKNLINCRCLEL